MIKLRSVFYTYLWSLITLFSYLSSAGFSGEVWLGYFLFGVVGSIVILLAISFYAIPIHILLQHFEYEAVWGYLLSSLAPGPIFLFVFRPFHFYSTKEMLLWLILCQGISSVGAIAFWWYQVGQHKYHSKRYARLYFYAVELAIIAAVTISSFTAH